MKWSDPENFLKAQFVIFRCQKYVKKRVHGNDKKNYLVPLKTAPGRSIYHYSYFSSQRLQIVISVNHLIRNTKDIYLGSF